MNFNAIADRGKYKKIYNLLRTGHPYVEDFETVFQSAIGMVNETNDLHNDAESAMIQFAMGQSENTHDLLIAQSKANISLQYTAAVKDKLLEAYREIMQMQI